MSAYTFTITNRLLFDKESRIEKARQIRNVLDNFLGKNRLKNKKILSIGCATGIIPYYFSRYVRKGVGIDLDSRMIAYAKKHYVRQNLSFAIMDAQSLTFPSNSFDVVFCNQLLNWVKSPRKVLQEVYRVLKPGGICFVGNTNKFTLYDGQYFLPFLSILPKPIAFWMVRTFRRVEPVYFSYLSYWQLQRLCAQFIIHDHSPGIVRSARQLGFKQLRYLQLISSIFPFWILKMLSPFSPNLMWILQKPSSRSH